MRSETGFDYSLYERFPTEKRPDSEVEELNRIWRAPKGWARLTAVNNNYVGFWYVVTAFGFFLAAGILALGMRVQLAAPMQDFLGVDTYNQFFTMHGTVMMFLFAVPMVEAIGIMLLPQMLAARDLPFPRLSAFAFWAYFVGGTMFFLSLFVGLAPDGGWFMYPPLTSIAFSPGINTDFWLLGIGFIEISAIAGAIEIIVGVLRTRAPGMTLDKMPMFAWAMLVFAVMIVVAFPSVVLCTMLLEIERAFNWPFFDALRGGDPMLWQHLFWIFGHPEVYIIILPSFGIISEVIPAFSRKPIFGYSFMVFSGIAIGFMGWGVWAHHMFVSGIGPISVFAFSMATMFIAVPTGVKILNWLATMWGGKLHFSTAMLFAVGTVTMFTIGGLSGVTHSLAPADTQQTDTYYIVAHFHYVIFGGGVLGLFAGVYFWWPKVFGHLLNERRGKIHFWTMLIGFNLTFGPMHVLGLQGMSRRINTYSSGFGFEFWNLVATIGSYILGASVLYFLWNVYKSKKEAPNLPAPGPDPWDARSLEWSIPSPTPEHNFDEIPVVESQDDWWFRKYNIEDDGSVVRISSAEDAAQKGDAVGVHLPSPSFWPLVLAIGLPLIGYGVIFNLWLCVVGGLLTGGAIYAWVLEPVDDPDADGHGHDDHHDGDDPDGELATVGAAGDDTEGEG